MRTNLDEWVDNVNDATFDHWRSRLIEQPEICSRLHTKATHSAVNRALLTPEDAEQWYHAPNKRGVTKTCSCPARPNNYTWELFGLIKFTTSTSAPHLPSCRLYRYGQRHYRRDLSIFSPLIWTYVGVQATLKVTRGARACILSRTLLCRRIVPHDSPLFEALIPRLGRDANMLDVQRVRKRLTTMFSKGEATPADVSEYNETILEVRSTTSPNVRPLLRSRNLDSHKYISLTTNGTDFGRKRLSSH